MQQLLLFPEEKEKKDYDQEIESLWSKYDNLRKSQHARITGLQKEITDLKKEIEFLKGKICKEGLFL
jgi:peptidoglycan hydrolase CwlO-like protein